MKTCHFEKRTYVCVHRSAIIVLAHRLGALSMVQSLAYQYTQRTGRAHLHNIAPIANIASILQYGILSHERASCLLHHDISMQDVQDIRSAVIVDHVLQRSLHQYANLYFDARNPMLYKRRTMRDSLCVLHVSYGVLDLKETVVADRNAAAFYTAFYHPADALPKLNFALIFADYWTDDDQVRYYMRKSIKCAEVLVWECVPARFIVGASVFSEQSAESLRAQGFLLPIYIDKHLFFC